MTGYTLFIINMIVSLRGGGGGFYLDVVFLSNIKLGIGLYHH